VVPARWLGPDFVASIGAAITTTGGAGDEFGDESDRAGRDRGGEKEDGGGSGEQREGGAAFVGGGARRAGKAARAEVPRSSHGQFEPSPTRTAPLELLELQAKTRVPELDFARKVVGVGSVGTCAWIALLIGRDGQDPLFLQMKEAEASVLEDFLGPSEFKNHGKRVVTGQRLMQATSDIFLGRLHVKSGIDGQGRDFYGRQLKDWKGSAETEQMVPQGMAAYGKLCGWTLARAHARSGDRIAIASYLGNSDSFDKAILAFSEAYAGQNDRDYNELQAAVRSGKIAAETGL
jgi:hypothetical protein